MTKSSLGVCQTAGVGETGPQTRSRSSKRRKGKRGKPHATVKHGSAVERMGQVRFGYPTPDGDPAEASHWHAGLLWRWKFALAVANNRIKGTTIERGRLAKVLGGDDGLLASTLNRQTNPTERDACLQSGDDLALVLASPSFQRC